MSHGSFLNLFMYFLLSSNDLRATLVTFLYAIKAPNFWNDSYVYFLGFLFPIKHL